MGRNLGGREMADVEEDFDDAHKTATAIGVDNLAGAADRAVVLAVTPDSFVPGRPPDPPHQADRRRRAGPAFAALRQHVLASAGRPSIPPEHLLKASLLIALLLGAQRRPQLLPAELHEVFGTDPFRALATRSSRPATGRSSTVGSSHEVGSRRATASGPANADVRRLNRRGNADSARARAAAAGRVSPRARRWGRAIAVPRRSCVPARASVVGQAAGVNGGVHGVDGRDALLAFDSLTAAL